MSDSVQSSISTFFDGVESPVRSLVVVNRREPNAVQNLLRSAFDGQSVTVSESELPDVDDDVVIVVEDGEIVAASPLEDVMNAFLLINSDTYITGRGSVENVGVPDVLTALDDVVFDLRGYPVSNKEKLLLILISRHIEQLALQTDSGRLRSTFQRLSRFDDERGTRDVYEALAASGVDVHVYGQSGRYGQIPDEIPDVTVHTGTNADYRRSWCVVFVPERPTDDHAALVAVETGPNVWRGQWTYDADRVRDIDQYLDTNL